MEEEKGQVKIHCPSSTNSLRLPLSVRREWERVVSQGCPAFHWRDSLRLQQGALW